MLVLERGAADTPLVFTQGFQQRSLSTTYDRLSCEQFTSNRRMSGLCCVHTVEHGMVRMKGLLSRVAAMMTLVMGARTAIFSYAPF